MQARVALHHCTTGHAAAARKADIRDMAETSRPNNPAAHAVEASTQLKDEATNCTRDDVTTKEAGEASNSAGAQPTDATRDDGQEDAAETQKQEEKHRPSKLKLMWHRLGLDPTTLVLMLK